MELPIFELDRNATRLWDLEVPVILDKEEKTLKAYLVGGIEEPSYYNELCYLLGKVGSDYKVTLVINTPGGVIDTAVMVCNAIRTCKAQVTAELTGTVASAGTIITMVCDDISVDPHLSFMIHNYSGSISGKGHEMKARQKFVDAHLNHMFKSFYEGFVTDDEIEGLLDGNDIWLNADEVSQRWENRQTFLSTSYEEQ